MADSKMKTSEIESRLKLMLSYANKEKGYGKHPSEWEDTIYCLACERIKKLQALLEIAFTALPDSEEHTQAYIEFKEMEN